MINETLEADRAYQKDKADAYERGYKQGKADAERERKRGKWIEYEQKFILEESLKTVQKTVRECSVCTAKIAGMVGIMNYCPNCGADMRIKETDYDYERAVEQLEYDILYEPTFNQDDGSM